MASAKRWAGRAGIAAIAFFTIKGLAWLVVPALVIAWRTMG